MKATIIPDQNERAHNYYYKLHRCLKISLSGNAVNGDSLSVHTNDIVRALAKSIESGETYVDNLMDVWCDYFIECNEKIMEQNAKKITVEQLDGIIDTEAYTVKWWRDGCPKLRRDIFDDQEAVAIEADTDPYDRPQLNIYCGDRTGKR